MGLATTYYCKHCFTQLIEAEAIPKDFHYNLVCPTCISVTCHHKAFTKQQVAGAKKRREAALYN